MFEKIVLQVEDNEDDILLTQMAFKKCQTPISLIVARDGVEALDFVYSRGNYAQRDVTQNPSLVLLDLNLLFIDGFEVLKQIRSNVSTQHWPVIIMSSSLEETDLARCNELGADQYYRKPVSYEQFVTLIQQICSKWLA